MPEDGAAPAVVVAPVELDYASAPQFRRELDAAFATGAPLVVAELGSTTFCDSSGLKVLVHAAKQANSRNERFEVRHPSPMLLRMAGILGATSLLGLPGNCWSQHSKGRHGRSLVLCLRCRPRAGSPGCSGTSGPTVASAP